MEMCLIKLSIYKSICVFTPETMLIKQAALSIAPSSEVPGDRRLLTVLQLPKSEFLNKKTYKSHPQSSRSFKMRKFS